MRVFGDRVRSQRHGDVMVAQRQLGLRLGLDRGQPQIVEGRVVMAAKLEAEQLENPAEARKRGSKVSAGTSSR